MATLIQSITLLSNVFGRIKLPIISLPLYSNSFEIGDKILSFDNLFPNENLQDKDFQIYIYEGVKNLVEIHLGNELKYGIFDSFSATRVFVEKL